MTMKKEFTHRGFAYYKFKDCYGEGCSLQASSLATESAIWLGIDDANPQIMASKIMEGGQGWVKYPIPEDVIMSTRMHLTQKEVAELIPILKKFVKTGEI